ncbi:hypothetical protein [Shimia sp. MMG029]|uniref:hypothetical protein n=1 Tax=Shimia sp. MMG029 TaxID=3021978 RepID=UPI0022FEFAD6|nr:hypothetical protein [Shimia sp. MMG029]MDA5556609.1 hypothetical protein [Shimia sp. MMG029]
MAGGVEGWRLVLRAAGAGSVSALGAGAAVFATTFAAGLAAGLDVGFGCGVAAPLGFGAAFASGFALRVVVTGFAGASVLVVTVLMLGSVAAGLAAVADAARRAVVGFVFGAALRRGAAGLVACFGFSAVGFGVAKAGDVLTR